MKVGGENLVNVVFEWLLKNKLGANLAKARTPHINTTYLKTNARMG